MLRRLTLALLACLALLGAAAGAVMVWTWLNPSNFPPWEKAIIQKELGWQLPGDDREELRQMIVSNPLPVIQLLIHDSQRVRNWARAMLLQYDVSDTLSDELLDLISAELGSDSEYDKPFLAELLAYSGERGVGRLVHFYRSARPIEPVLHRSVCSVVEHGEGEELLPELLAVVQDDTVLLENRIQAMKALGCIRRGAPDNSPPPVSPGEEAIASLAALLPRLPEPVAGAARAALEKIERRDWLPADSPDRSGPNEFLSPEEDGGAQALARLDDKGDWLVAGFAAEQLARHNVHAAIPDLERVAATHWYAPVRKTAEQAVRILQGKEPPPAHWKDNSSYHRLVLSHEGAAFDAWYKANPSTPSLVLHEIRGLADDASSKIAPAKNAVLTRLQPRLERLLVEEPGRLPVVYDNAEIGMKPTVASPFAGGKLLGGDVGDLGNGTVFRRNGDLDRFFPTENVTRFLRVPFGLLVLGEPGQPHGIVYLASEHPGGRISIDGFLRLPLQSGPPETLRSGEVVIPCELGDIVISPAGEIHMREKFTP